MSSEEGSRREKSEKLIPMNSESIGYLSFMLEKRLAVIVPPYWNLPEFMVWSATSDLGLGNG